MFIPVLGRFASSHPSPKISLLSCPPGPQLRTPHYLSLSRGLRYRPSLAFYPSTRGFTKFWLWFLQSPYIFCLYPAAFSVVTALDFHRLIPVLFIVSWWFFFFFFFCFEEEVRRFCKPAFARPRSPSPLCDFRSLLAAGTSCWCLPLVFRISCKVQSVDHSEVVPLCPSPFPPYPVSELQPKKGVFLNR